MKALKVLGSGLTATSLMSLFSYGVSRYQNKNYKEPELLAGLLKEALLQKGWALPAGWSTHYSMGISWAVVFHLLFEKGVVKPDMKNGLMLGGLSGLTAILIWGLAFKLHPNPPETHYKRFYGHLFLAHLVYSLIVTASNQKG